MHSDLLNHAEKSDFFEHQPLPGKVDSFPIIALRSTFFCISRGVNISEFIATNVDVGYIYGEFILFYNLNVLDLLVQYTVL